MATGRLEAIYIKRARGGVMDNAVEATLDERGLVGNANRGGFRAITIISAERWKELMAEIRSSITPDSRRANLLVSGIDLENSRGLTLTVGGTQLRIGGETRPCELMEEAAAGLQEAMKSHWGGGAYATVIQGGRIAVGDTVTLS